MIASADPLELLKTATFDTRTETTSYTYDAVAGDHKRRAPRQRVQHEDRVLDTRKREKMSATVNDVVRNFNIVSWMVRKHLDYVTQFSFQGKVSKLSKSANKRFNKELEDFMDRWSRREASDAARRHPLRRRTRIAEARKVLDGDFGILKIAGSRSAFTRGRLQGLESDLIKNPSGRNAPRDMADQRWMNGVHLDRFDGAIGYGIHKRARRGTEYLREVPAKNLYLHAHFDSVLRDSQVRGVSAVGGAINNLRDTYEILDYTKARHKIARLFGLAVFRDDDEPLPGTTETDVDGDGKPDSFSVQLEEGPFVLDLNSEDRAEFLENNTNAEETVNLLRFLMQVCILALDLPISMLDERETTFFGGRGALMNYLKSCTQKILDVVELLNDITRWRIGLAILDGELELPAGLMFDDIMWQWVPAGVPWWDPAKEVKGFGMALGACLTNFDDVIREVYGGRHNFEENLEINAGYWDMAKAAGFPLTIPGVTNTASDELNQQIIETVEDRENANAA